MSAARENSSHRREVSRRDFLKFGGGVAGAAALGMSGCADIVSGFKQTATVPPGTLILTKGPDDTGTLPKVLDKFNKEGHGFKVEWREMPSDTGQYFDKMRTEFQAGGGESDIIGADVIWPAQFAAQGWIEDLSDLFTEEMRSDFLPSTIETSMYRGKIYGVPWYSDAGLLYYRKDLLDKAGFKPPKTWDELRTQAQKVQDQEGIRYGFTFQGSEYEGGVCNFCEYVWNAGGEILDPQDPTKVLIGQGAAGDGLEAAQQHVSTGTAPLAVATFKEDESLFAFIQGDSVFNRNWPFAYAVAQDPAAGSVLKVDQVGVAHLPAQEQGQQAFATLGGWDFCISAFSQKKDQAWEFIKWAIQPRIQKEFAINAGYLPGRKSLFKDKELLKAQPVMKLAQSSYATTKPRPSLNPFYSDMSLDIAQEFNDLLKRDQTAQGAVSTLESKLTRLANAAENVFNIS